MAAPPQDEPGNGDIFEIGRELAEAFDAEARHRAGAPAAASRP